MPVILEFPFGITVDFSFWTTILGWPTNELMKAVFAMAGWAVLIIVFFYMGAELWISYRQSKFTKSWKWTLLAIDIPPNEIQSPKAVEQIFAHLSGAHVSPNVGEKYWNGVKQKWFSLEIISIEGYIQFLVYTESQFRDLVEAAIYAQYPMAEITEVEDYVNNIPSKYPNDEYEAYGLEFGLENEEAYPIRTYPEFEHSVTKDFMFNDPIASVLENFTRISSGENFWFQIILEPFGDKWKEKGIALVKKIIAQKKPEPKNNFLSLILSIPLAILGEFWEHISSSAPADPKDKKKEKEPPAGKISDLSPGVKNAVAAVEEKIAKVGFRTKLRILYAARKEVFNPSKCVKGFVGSLNQFNYSGRNALIPKSATEAYYAFKTYRTNDLKVRFVSAFKKRKLKVGKTPYVLNIEELATLWHFPLPLVKTPLLQKASVKRAEPPINLPTETFESPLRLKRGGEEAKKAEIPTEPAPPEELPYG